MDHLSSLHDAILLHILSFTDLQTLLRTSVLSKRWTHLWESSLVMDFDSFPGFPDAFIDSFLALHMDFKIRRFEVSLEHDAIPHERIDSLIFSLMARGVEELNLDILPSAGDEYESATERYEVPQCAFFSRSLTSLSLRHCEIDPSMHFCLPNLRTLYLRMVDLSDTVIKSLVLGCPLLEDLTLHDCNMHDELNIHLESSRVKSLKIIEWNWLFEMPKLEIVAPNLFSLEFTDDMPRQGYVAKNLGALVVASFSFDSLLECSEYRTTNFVGIFEQIRHVKVLKLCSGCIMELSLRDIEDSSTLVPFAVQTLELKTGLCKFELLWLACILRRFINLEVLTINFEHYFEHCDFDKTGHWESLETSFENSLQHIKTVKIHGIFVGSEDIQQKIKDAVVEDIKFQKKLITGKTKDGVVEGILKEEGFITELIKIMLKKSAILEMQTFAKYGRYYLNLVFKF